jgi:hypothetical protein
MTARRSFTSCCPTPVFTGSSLGSDKSQGGISTHGKLQLISFCVFEACVGIFWPSMMALRAHYVPEEMRSTIINIFRIPLNLFVCLVLFKVGTGTSACTLVIF